MTDRLTRFVVTYVDSHTGFRTLAHPCQGRYTFATAEEAGAYMLAMLSNNGPELIASIWGPDPRFEVRPCSCYPGHFDPAGIYFET